MSVVAWDGKTLAADRQGICGEMRIISTKMRRLLSGAVCAWTGDHECGLALVRWYTGDARPDQWPAFQKDKDRWARLIVATATRVVYFEQEPEAQLVEDPFIAWGSGRDLAMGALAMGATAKEAVEVANRFCVSCGIGVDVMVIDQ